MIQDKYLIMIDEIQKDFINPSSVIAKNAIGAFQQAAIEFVPKKDFASLEEFVDLLIKAKPSMASLSNLLRFSMKEALKEEKDLNGLADKIKSLMDKARQNAIQKAMDYCLLNNFTCFITASYSWVIHEFFMEYSALKKLNIFCMESVYNDTYYGSLMQNKFHKDGISAHLVPDNEVVDGVSKCEAAFISADAFHKQKGAVNGYPSFELAEACKMKIPFSVVAESYKKTDKIHYGDVFQFIPADLISNFFTDNIFTSAA